MTKVLVTAFSQSRGVPLIINGMPRTVPIGMEVDVDDATLAALRGTDAKFEVLGAQAPAAAPVEEGANGGPPPTPPDPLLARLDGNSAAAVDGIEDLGVEDLGRLLEAERAGKARKTVIGPLEAAIAAKANPAPTA